MGKRKYEELERKLKRLKRKLKSRKRHRHDLCTSSDEFSDRESQEMSEKENIDNHSSTNNQFGEDNYDDVMITSSPEPEQQEMDVPIQNPIQVTTELTNLPGNNELLEPELTTEILNILGDEPAKTEILGPSIHKEISNRWSHILTNGLKEDIKNEILKTSSFSIPENLKLAQPPELNAEIKAAVNENIVKRDGILKDKQKIISGVISSIAYLTSNKISQDENKDLLKNLSDIGRLLCHFHYSETVTRQNFLLASLNKEMKDNLKEAKRDQFLFGTDLQEKLKSIKAISKTGAELRASVSKIKKFTKGKQAEPSTSRSLNWRDPPPPPPPARRPTATARLNSTAGGRKQQPQTTRRAPAPLPERRGARAPARSRRY